MVKNCPETAIKFGAYEQIKYLMGQEGAQLPPFQKFIAGTLAGFIAQSSIYPMEVLRTRMALRKTGQYNGISDCARKIYKSEGIRAFYRGYLMNTLGIAGVGVDLALYETLKKQYKLLYPESQPSVPVIICMANTSSTLAMFSTYPLFLIRTRMQTASHSKQTIYSIAQNVLKHDGFFGFYRGAFANLAKVAPSASIGNENFPLSLVNRRLNSKFFFIQGYISYEYFSSLLGVKR